MKKIHTEVKIYANEQKFHEFSGKLPEEDFELLWDLLEIVWHMEHHEELAAMKKYLKKIKVLVAEYNKEMDKFLGEGILVSGQNLSQLKEYPLKATVLRPLVAFWKEEIREELKRFNS